MSRKLPWVLAVVVITGCADRDTAQLSGPVSGVPLSPRSFYGDPCTAINSSGSAAGGTCTPIGQNHADALRGIADDVRGRNGPAGYADACYDLATSITRMLDNNRFVLRSGAAQPTAGGYIGGHFVGWPEMPVEEENELILIDGEAYAQTTDLGGGARSFDDIVNTLAHEAGHGLRDPADMLGNTLTHPGVTNPSSISLDNILSACGVPQ